MAACLTVRYLDVLPRNRPGRSQARGTDMARMGMDAEGVQAVGESLKKHGASLEVLVRQIDGTVRGLVGGWDGADAARFTYDWWPRHRADLLTLVDAVNGLGQAALNNVAEQRRASGDDGALEVGHGPQPHSPTPAATSSPTPPAAAAVPHGPEGTQHFAQSDAARIALNEVGTTRPTGWNQEGECVKSVQRWINEAGGHFGGGGVVSGYANSGAVGIGLGEVQAGDVIQYTSTTTPEEWVNGVHTVMVVGVNSDGSLHIVQSNAKAPGLVDEVMSWTPHPPTGLEARVWRFGQV